MHWQRATCQETVGPTTEKLRWPYVVQLSLGQQQY